MKSRRIWWCLPALLLLPGNAGALDNLTRPVGPIHHWSAADLERFHEGLVQVKFVEGSEVAPAGRAFTDASGLDLAGVNAALAANSVTEVRPTFKYDRSTLRQWKADGEARSGVTGPDLSLWFDLRVSGGRQQVADLVNALNDDGSVEIAHPVPFAEPAEIRTPHSGVAAWAPAAPPASSGGDPQRVTPDFSGQQSYLYAPPVGLNAPAAWALNGGLGQGMKFIDVELCWTEDHEDFSSSNMFYIGGAAQDPGYETHGTAVLGEVIGQHNGYGVKGFAPETQWGVVAVTEAEWPTVPHYFQEAVDHLSAGDVWLIELQMYPPGKSATPMEWLQVNYDVIWTSSYSLGIVCVEAGANGSQNLDDPSWGNLFNRLFRDSGATMVAAGTPTGLTAEWFTNYGTRMDVHAWGSSIVTTGYGDLYNGGTLQTRYTATFGGTSGASPMVTGSALCLQGIARAYLGSPLDPITLRRILNQTGTPYSGQQRIGPRPDLAAASDGVLAILAAPGAPLALGAAPVASPSPFQGSTTIRFQLSRPDQAAVRIYDPTGRVVRTLFRGPLGSGAHHLLWDSRDDQGREIGEGVYFYRIDAGDASGTGRVLKIR
mgnify:CR=1 FL=1